MRRRGGRRERVLRSAQMRSYVHEKLRTISTAARNQPTPAGGRPRLPRDRPRKGPSKNLPVGGKTLFSPRNIFGAEEKTLVTNLSRQFLSWMKSSCAEILFTRNAFARMYQEFVVQQIKVYLSPQPKLLFPAQKVIAEITFVQDFISPT